MIPNKRKPEWLREMWEQKTEQTVERVDAAVKRLRNDGATVTLASISSTVADIYGSRMSTNTILRNPRAYDIYRAARTPAPRRCRRDTDLNSLLVAVSGPEKARLQSQILRLRRRSKEALMATIIRLERERTQQAMTENALRDELLRAALCRAPSDHRKPG